MPPSSLRPSVVMPSRAAAGPDDGVDGDQDDGKDSLAIPVSGGPAAAASAGAAW